MSALYRHQGKDRQSRPRVSQQLGSCRCSPRARGLRRIGEAQQHPTRSRVRAPIENCSAPPEGASPEPARGDRDRVAPTAEANCRILIEADALDEAVDIGLARHATGEYRWGLFQCQRPTEPIGCRVGVRWRAQPLIGSSIKLRQRAAFRREVRPATAVDALKSLEKLSRAPAIPDSNHSKTHKPANHLGPTDGAALIWPSHGRPK